MVLKQIDIEQAIRSGDDDQILQYLYKNTMPKICNYVKNNRGSLEEGQDVFQDAVLKLYQYIHTGNKILNIEAFVYTTSKNLWINKAIRDKKMTAFPDDIDFVGNDPNSLDLLLTKEQEETIHPLFDQLGEVCKNILTYTIYHKMSMDEIAVKLGWANANTVKTKNYKCKKQLTKLANKQPHLLEVLKA